jgi:hypothetical protein
MECMDVELRATTEDEDVVFWRADELRRAGYDPAAILELAPRMDIDLHIAVGLLGRGCSPGTALRILI